MATSPSILTQRILWTEEPGRLQSIGPQKSQTWLSEKAHTQIKSDCERRRTFFIFWSIVDFQCCVLYSKVNQLYIYIYPLFFQILFSCRSLQSIKQNSLCYTIGSYYLFILYINSVYMSIPISQFIPPLLSSLVTISLFSTSMTLFLFYK